MEKKIQLRALELDDVDLLLAWENDRETWFVSQTVQPFSRYAIEQYVVDAVQNDIFATRQLRMIVEETETQNAVGLIDLFDFNPQHHRAGIGVLISKSERNKGYAGEALQQLCAYAKEVLNLHQVFCNITEDNESSIKLFKNQGFEQCGRKKDWFLRDGKWIDELMFQKKLNEK